MSNEKTKNAASAAFDRALEIVRGERDTWDNQGVICNAVRRALNDVEAAIIEARAKVTQ